MDGVHIKCMLLRVVKIYTSNYSKLFTYVNVLVVGLVVRKCSWEDVEKLLREGDWTGVGYLTIDLQCLNKSVQDLKM